MKLSPGAEEVATFFAKMLDHEYTTKDIFRKNFFKDWRKVGENKSLVNTFACQISQTSIQSLVIVQRFVLECNVMF